MGLSSGIELEVTGLISSMGMLNMGSVVVSVVLNLQCTINKTILNAMDKILASAHHSARTR